MGPIARKQRLKDELVVALTRELETLERAHRAAIEGATHEEAKPENEKDTRALEQSYVARGQALRIHQLQRAVAEVAATPVRALADGAPAEAGALVTVQEGGVLIVFFLALHGGGMQLADRTVQVVTPLSPLGRALLGRVAGDECETEAGGRVRRLAVAEVA